ncbi:hypothetical protein NK6_4919 [Bradyrhizobium diazoefficiens]|uniref:Uncharacterized protein n=1 Tax=Bradyrhizobium diazoefficiens TaxID=1355477 RepID=A0A0E4FUQ3_9BRAD|nr:hypothetical protein NK6_4919 [Bradyrhizobium diazoefficiens]
MGKWRRAGTSARVAERDMNEPSDGITIFWRRKPSHPCRKRPAR